MKTLEDAVFDGTFSYSLLSFRNAGKEIARFKTGDDITRWVLDVVALLEKTDTPEARELLARVRPFAPPESTG